MSTTETTTPTADNGELQGTRGHRDEAVDVKPVELEVLVEEISIDGMCGVY